MLWMETYLFYCSVRLGVVVISILTFLQLFIPSILLFVLGIHVLNPIVELFQNDDHYRHSDFVKKTIHWLENYPQNFFIITHCYLYLHMATCLSATYGAIRLKKWLLLPFAVLELIRVIFCLAGHILLMIMLKKILNLGVLIAFTLAGGFLILYLAYNWAASVALFQIIDLINSDRYKSIYGDDPFKPHELPPSNNNQFAYGTVENVRVLVTPNSNDVDEQKKKFARKSPQPIIAVLPISYNDERVPFISGRNERVKRQNFLWQRSEKQQQEQLQNNRSTLDDSNNYANWQWAELVGNNNRRNMIISKQLY